MVGSTDEIVVGGHKVRARQYPWGTVEGKSLHVGIVTCLYCLLTLCSVSVYVVWHRVLLSPVENEAHCDFVRLREMLLR